MQYERSSPLMDCTSPLMDCTSPLIDCTSPLTLDWPPSFALQGLIELRQNNYVARRQVEGPKKISEVHSDAQREATRQRNAPAPRRGPSQDLSAYGGPPSRQ